MLGAQNKNSSYFVEWISDSIKYQDGIHGGYSQDLSLLPLQTPTPAGLLVGSVGLYYIIWFVFPPTGAPAHYYLSCLRPISSPSTASWQFAKAGC